MQRKLLYITLILLLSSTTALFAEIINTKKFVQQAKQEVGEIEPKKLKEMIDEDEDFILLDIREKEQRLEGEIYADESYAITRGNLEFEIRNKVKNSDTLIITYCRAGSRGALAALQLKKLGYKNVKSLKGGLKAWIKLGYLVETGYGSVVITIVDEY